jgi:hypothetical protein
MIPKTKKAVLKKKPGRPSVKRTALAVLRQMLTVPKITNEWLKRKGAFKVVNGTLRVSTVAKWLDVAPDTVRCIERHRPGYRLTEEHAEKIAYQTGVSLDWLLAGDGSEPVKQHWIAGTRRNPYGTGCLKPFTQNDFEEHRKALSRQDANSDLQLARHTLLFSSAKIAAILARGLERGQAVEYVMKLNRALRSVYFDKEEKPAVWPTGFEPAADFNIRPTLIALENRAREIQREKKGEPCPDCCDGWVRCPKCHHKPKPGEIPRELVNCELCKNKRILPCEKCKGKGHVGIEPPRR